MPRLLVTVPVEVRLRKMEVSWTILPSGDANPTLHGEMFEPPRDREFLDGWTMRERFLGLRRSEQALLKFLRWAGRFPPITLLADFEMSAFWEWQDIFRKALVQRNSQWRKQFDKFPNIIPDYLLVEERLSDVQFLLKGKKTRAVIQAACGLYAIGTTIELDLLSGAQFKWCARPDCRKKLFQPQSRHQTKYCSYECAHLQSVRNARGTIVASEGEY
jgi:hypothetical protein